MEIKWIYDAEEDYYNTLTYWYKHNGSYTYSEKIMKAVEVLQKEIANRYEKQYSKHYKAPHIIVFIENIENFAITHFETLKNIFEISQKIGIYFVLSIGKIERKHYFKHYFKLLGLCNYLLIVADNLV